MKITEIFRETCGNVIEVDKSRPFSFRNYLPSCSDSPDLIPRQSRLLCEMVNILFIITRSKNSNTVVYRYKSSDQPIEAFWQRFADSPETVTAEAPLRQELSWTQRKLAYGIKAVCIPGTNSYTTTLTACPGFPMTLAQDPTGSFRITLTIDNTPCYLFRIHVQATENMIGLPTVVYTNIHAIDISTGQEIIAKVKPCNNFVSSLSECPELKRMSRSEDTTT